MILRPFQPKNGSGQTLSATTTSGSTPATFATGNKQLLVTNFGTGTAYVRMTDSATTTAASAADMPVLPSTQIIMSIDPEHTRFSYVTGTGTATLHVMLGEGF